MSDLNLELLAQWYGQYGLRTGMSARLNVPGLPKSLMEEIAKSLKLSADLHLEVRRFPGKNTHYWFADRKQTQRLMCVLEPYRTSVPSMESNWVPKPKPLQSPRK